VHRALVEQQQGGIEDCTATGAMSATSAVVGVMDVIVSHVFSLSMCGVSLPAPHSGEPPGRPSGGCLVVGVLMWDVLIGVTWHSVLLSRAHFDISLR
jgi:hypothetical protein